MASSPIGVREGIRTGGHSNLWEKVIEGQKKGNYIRILVLDFQVNKF